MYIEPETRTGGVGWMPTRPITTDEVLRVLRGDIPEDGQHRNAYEWAQNIVNRQDFIEDLSNDLWKLMFELAARNLGTKYRALNSHLRDTIDAMVAEYNQELE